MLQASMAIMVISILPLSYVIEKICKGVAKHDTDREIN